MSRRSREAADIEPTETAEHDGSNEVPVSEAPKRRGIVLKEDIEGHGGAGETRVEYIRRRIFDEGATRTEVAKELGVM